MMSKSDLTPEEQQMIPKSKDPSFRMTAHGTSQTTEEATVCVFDLDMFFQIQLVKESPAVLSLGKLCVENGFSYEWHPGQPSYLIENGKKIECNTDNHIPLVVPGVQETEHQTKALENGSEHQPSGRSRATSGNRMTRTAATTHVRIDEEIFKFDRRISSGRGQTISSNSSFRTSSSKTFFKQIRRTAQFIHSFQKKDPNCEVCRTKVTRAPCRRHPDDRAAGHAALIFSVKCA